MMGELSSNAIYRSLLLFSAPIFSKEYIIQNLRKKFWIRSSFFSFVLAILVLIDNYIVNKRVFDIKQVSEIGSHENIFVVLVIYSIIALVINMVK